MTLKATINQEYLLSQIAKIFSTMVSLEVCKRSEILISENRSVGKALEANEKLYYNKYATAVCESLNVYLKKKKIKQFVLNRDKEKDKSYDFILRGKEDTKISLNSKSIEVKDIIPQRLMKICGIRGNSTMHRQYTASYAEITSTAYEKISRYERYSEIPDGKKNKYLIAPIRDLFVTTMTKKRKITPILFKHLFSETDRIVVDIKKTGFTVYDFSRQLEEPESYNITTDDDDPTSLTITFNNDAVFRLELRTNAVQVKEHLSLKFRTTFENMDDTCTVHSTVF